MNDWPHTDNDPDDELRMADSLIVKADAFLRKHHAADLRSAPNSHTEHIDDELPILTDVVTDFDDGIPLLDEVAPLPPDTPASAAAPPVSTAEAQARERATLVEHLVQIDTLIAREVEAWLCNELPQLLSRELDALSDRLRVETLAHLRATLLPTLSTHIASRLDEAGE
ncbi:hypothetical protein J5J83_22155 [Azoarcus sp. L1K30]|uniref:hypothetical protein n=1 Tax=Azoarcus sp. L1K30 TaxID=2820277 RepID=UPI001B81A9DA|nr:hypothetical protein [Azoarcus sp. L1K30]MBR0568838.1 hypothetical protein [Azoarcus sp. L1K30]